MPSNLSIPLAFKLWKKGTPLRQLYKRAGRTLRGPFTKLAGGKQKFQQLAARAKAARKAPRKAA